MDESAAMREQGNRLMPKFDDKGLMTGVVVDHHTKQVLMVAFLNEEAFAKTQGTGLAHFYSRSRKSLWCKGETSGNTLKVVRMMTDCDQDALILECEPAGPSCHTGAVSCFYREVDGENLRRM